MKKLVGILCVSALFLSFLWMVSPDRIASKPVVDIIGEDSSSLQAMDAIKDDFETASGVQIKFHRLPFDAAFEKSNSDLALGFGQYEIICQYSASLAPFVNNRYVLLLDEMESLIPNSAVSRDFESDFFPGVWRETGYFKPNWSQKVEKVSYPFAATTMVLVYRKSMFESPVAKEVFKRNTGRELQVPATWEDYLAAAEAFTDATANTYGVVMEGGPGGYLYWEWCNYAFGMGGGVAKKESGWESDINTKFILASPETVAASELYFGLKPYNYGDFLSVGSAEKRELFLNNKIAMSIMWSDYVPELLKSPEASDFGFAVVPGKVSMLGGATFFVNRKSPYKREAVEYMLSLMNTATQVELMKQGMASPFRSPYNDPGVQGIPYVASFRDSLERGVYMIDAGVDSQIIQDAITEVIQDIWIHGGDVKSKLAEAQAKIELERMKLF